MQEIKHSANDTYSNVSFVYDRNLSSLVFINEAFAKFAKQEIEKIDIDFLLSIIHPEDRKYVTDKFSELISSSLHGSVEFRISFDDEIRWMRLTPFLLDSNNKQLIAANVADITAEWNNLDSIRRYANKKNSILNMLAHDLRGPLEIAHTLAKSINNKIDDPGLLNMTKSISSILGQSIDMIADLIDRELIETVDVELAMKRVDIVMKVGEYIEECKRSEPLSDRVFRFTTSKDSIYMDLDEAKFMQIMNNLMTNALKFTHPGDEISVEIADKDDLVLFSFSDNGIGIPENFHETLFDKFTKARRKGLNGEPTMGLGLSIVKTIVEWHKGKVWFESQEDSGTQFFFEIPKISPISNELSRQQQISI